MRIIARDYNNVISIILNGIRLKTNTIFNLEDSFHCLLNLSYVINSCMYVLIIIFCLKGLFNNKLQIEKANKIVKKKLVLIELIN